MIVEGGDDFVKGHVVFSKYLPAFHLIPEKSRVHAVSLYVQLYISFIDSQPAHSVLNLVIASSTKRLRRSFLVDPIWV